MFLKSIVAAFVIASAGVCSAGERPRMFIKSADLPGLREKAKTTHLRQWSDLEAAARTEFLTILSPRREGRTSCLEKAATSWEGDLRAITLTYTWGSRHPLYLRKTDEGYEFLGEAQADEMTDEFDNMDKRMNVKNDSIVMQRRVFRDAKTNREVWQVTDGEFECVSPYMDRCAWSADDRLLVINSNRTGTWQPYLLEIETGKATQLLELNKGAYRNVAIDPVHNEAYVAGDGQVFAIHLESLRVRVAVNWSQLFPEEAIGKAGADTLVLNSNGTLLARPHTTPQGHPCILVAPTDGSNQFQRVLVSQAGIAGEHVLFCPGDDNVISMHASPDRQNDSNETPEHRAAQWRIRRDTRAMKPLVLVPPGFRAIHCLWGRSGNRFYLHRKTVPSWVPTALCSVNREGEDMRVHFETNEHKLGHCSPSPDEQWLATDSQDPGENILMLVHLERNEQHMLCWPNSSIKKARPHKRLPQLPPHTDTDVHPNFSSTGKYITYNSDISGRSQVYVVPVGDLVKSVRV